MKLQEQHTVCSGNFAGSICLAEVNIDAAPKSNDVHRLQSSSSLKTSEHTPTDDQQRSHYINSQEQHAVCPGKFAGSICLAEATYDAAPHSNDDDRFQDHSAGHQLPVELHLANNHDERRTARAGKSMHSICHAEAWQDTTHSLGEIIGFQGTNLHVCTDGVDTSQPSPL